MLKQCGESINNGQFRTTVSYISRRNFASDRNANNQSYYLTLKWYVISVSYFNYFPKSCKALQYIEENCCALFILMQDMQYSQGEILQAASFSCRRPHLLPAQEHRHEQKRPHTCIADYRRCNLIVEKESSLLRNE